MSHEGKEKLSFFGKFVLEFRCIFEDILFVYKNFLHWSISRAIVSIWGILLGIICSLPFFILAVILAWIDPINWLSYFAENVQEGALVYDNLAIYPYWFVSIIFLLLTSIIVFLLASSYSLLLMARISYKYTQRKLLSYKRNLYLSWKHIRRFMTLFTLNFVYLLVPVFIWCGGIFFTYFFYNSGSISFSFFSVSLLILTLMLIFAVAYISYRILFGYIILATQADPKKLHTARKYLHHSMKITKGKNIIKFFFLIAIYALVTFPFQYIETALTSKAQSLEDVLEFRLKIVTNIDAEDLSYYEYLTQEYISYTDQEIADKIVLYTWVNILYFVLYTLLFGGIFVLLLTSFYVHVLKKNI